MNDAKQNLTGSWILSTNISTGHSRREQNWKIRQHTNLLPANNVSFPTEKEVNRKAFTY